MLSNAARQLLPLTIFVIMGGSTQTERTAYSATGAPPHTDLHDYIQAGSGGRIDLPQKEYHIHGPLVIEEDETTLHGPATIIQHDARAPILRIKDASKVVLKDLTLTRAQAAEETHRAGLLATDSSWLRIEHVRVEDNHSDSAAIRLLGCSFSRVTGCDILNYKRVAVDDRTQIPGGGYAFRCIGGLGIELRGGRGNSLRDNKIIESRLFPTRQEMERYSLGSLTIPAKSESRTAHSNQAAKLEYAQNWHQGSAIIVSRTLPKDRPRRESTQLTSIIGNYIENAGQGIDLHCDRFVCAHNTIHNAMIGIKVMHGSRHGVVNENIIDRADLWGIMLGPGSLSHYATPASNGEAAREANHDGAIVVSGNTISNFGFGRDYWNWVDDSGSPSGYAIRLDYSPSPDLPPISEVVISSNVVVDAGRNGILDAGSVVYPGPRYRLALWIESPDHERENPRTPKNVTVNGNHFDPGTEGKANISLGPD